MVLLLFRAKIKMWLLLKMEGLSSIHLQQFRVCPFALCNCIVHEIGELILLKAVIKTVLALGWVRKLKDSKSWSGSLQINYLAKSKRAVVCLCVFLMLLF